MKEKIVKRMLSVILCIAVIITAEAVPSISITNVAKANGSQTTNPNIEVWDGSVANSFAGGTGTKKSPFLISSASELAYMAKMIDEGKNLTSYYKLISDIYLNDISDFDDWEKYAPKNSWVPIECGLYKKNSYGGLDSLDLKLSFDGNNHKIIGMYVNCDDLPDAKKRFLGLFGIVKGAKLYNINIEKSFVIGHDVNTLSCYAGGIVGDFTTHYGYRDGVIKNCHFDGKIISSVAGGVVGYLDTVWGSMEIEQCSSAGSIESKTPTVGRAGGIIGYWNQSYDDVIFSKCHNFSQVRGDGASGGIIGKLDFSASMYDNKVTISELYNSGNIAGTESAGGLIGQSHIWVSATNAYLKINDSYNIGKIGGKGTLGGLCGIVGNTIYYNGISTAKTDYNRCYDFDSDKLNSTERPLVGKKTDCKLQDCYSCNEKGSKYYLASMEFSQKENFNGFDFNKVWAMSKPLGRPILRNDTEYSDYTKQTRTEKDFMEYTYRADILMDDSIPSSSIWNSVIEQPGICEEIADSLGDGMKTAANLWRLIQDTGNSFDNPASEVDVVLREQDTYQAIIFDVLSQFSFDEIFGKPGEVVSNINGGLKKTNKIIKHLKEQAKNTYRLAWVEALTKDATKKWSDLSIDEQRAGLDAIDDFYKLGNADWVNSMSEKLKTAGIFSKLGGTIYETIEYVGNLYSMYEMTDAMKDVLFIMYQACPDSNTVLKKALKDNYDIISSSMLTFIEKVTTGAAMVMGRYTLNIWMGIFWDEVKKNLVAINPYVLVVWIAYKGSTFLCNTLFNTDKTIEAYYNMVAMKEFRDVVQETFENIRKEYDAAQTEKDAELFLAANQIIFNGIYNDWGYGIKFGTALDSGLLSKVEKLFGNKEMEETIKSMKSIQRSYKVDYASTLTSWIYYLEEDFPNEYLNYKGILDDFEKNYDLDEIVKSYKIACPVDIYIYDVENKLVASIVNNIPKNNTDDLIVYTVGEEKKILFTKASDKYRVEYVGNDTGAMDIVVNEFQDGNTVRVVNFNQLPLEKGKEYESDYSAEILKKAAYKLDNNGKTIYTDFDSLSEDNNKKKHTIKVQNGIIRQGNEIGREMKVQEGERVELIPCISDVRKTVEWSSSDDVTVTDNQNGTSYLYMEDKDVDLEGILVNSYNITATAQEGGTITPLGLTSVKEGKDQKYVVTASVGYEISEVVIDGVSKGAISEYLFDNVKENHTIIAKFTRVSGINLPTATPSTMSTVTPSTMSTATPSTTSTVTPSTTSTATSSTTSTVTPSITSTAAPSTTSTATPSITSTAAPSTMPTVTPSTTSTATSSTMPTVTPGITSTATSSTTSGIMSATTPTSAPAQSLTPTIMPTNEATARPMQSSEPIPETKPTIPMASIKPTEVPSNTSIPVDEIYRDDSNNRESVNKGTLVKDKATKAVYKVISTGKNRAVEYVRSTSKSAKSITIPASITINGKSYKVKSIGKSAFKGNNKLKTIKIGKNVAKIKKKALYKCKKLQKLKLGKNTIFIGDKAFYGCVRLQYLKIPKVKKIGSRAFYGCKNLKYILVKSNKLISKNVGKKAFGNSYALPRVKTDKKVWNLYEQIFISRGLSDKSVFVVDPVKLII